MNTKFSSPGQALQINLDLFKKTALFEPYQKVRDMDYSNLLISLVSVN